MSSPSTRPRRFAVALHPRVRCALAVAVTLAALGYGLGWRFGQIGAVDPAPWRSRVAPVAEAPIPSGTVVGLVPPASAEIFGKAFRYEAAWLRPDLRWRTGEGWPDSSATAWVVVVGPVPETEGWSTVWREGEVSVLRRTP